MVLNSEKISETSSDIGKDGIENIAARLLFNLGFKSNLQGTWYLTEAIVRKYTQNIESLCKQLYPQIAEKFHTKSQRVERSIRHTINECYASGNLVRANEMFGCQVVNSKYPPTNSEFISSVCMWLRLEKIADKVALN